MAKLLLVDDEKELRDICQLYLTSAGFEAETADNGENALSVLEKAEFNFDLILSDIMMPKMDGYALCEKVKATDKGATIPFVFISSLVTLEEKLKGYAAGGDDYVTKPVAMEELVFKIKRIFETRTQNAALKERIAYSNSAAMEAITYSADLGQILEFYKNSLLSANYSELASHLFMATEPMGLHCTIQIYTPDGVLTFSDQGVATPLEINVIELARKESRFFDFGPRTIINHERFSLLIKNMPIDKPSRYGALKDSLGALCNAIEARIKALIADSVDTKKSQILMAVQMAIDESKNTFGTIQRENMSAIEALIDELEEAFVTVGLTEQQEEKIRRIGEDCRTKSNNAFYKGESLNEKFDEIKLIMTKILNVKK